MAIFKPAVTKPPILVTGNGTVSLAPREIVSIHYYNSTAGVGRVDITNGQSNEGITLASAVTGGTDDWSPAQPARFDKIIVTFTTGTGIVTIQTN